MMDLDYIIHVHAGKYFEQTTDCCRLSMSDMVPFIASRTLNNTDYDTLMFLNSTLSTKCFCNDNQLKHKLVNNKQD